MARTHSLPQLAPGSCFPTQFLLPASTSVPAHISLASPGTSLQTPAHHSPSPQHPERDKKLRGSQLR